MITRLLIFLFFLSACLFAQSIEECMDCHSDEDLSKSIDDSTEISLFVDLEKYENSIHGAFECIDCHTSIEDVDHEPELPAVNCAGCHEDVQEEWKASVHGMAISDGSQLSATCSSCHGKHYILSSDEKESLTNRNNLSKTCGTCHSQPEVIRLFGKRNIDPIKAYEESIHARLVYTYPDTNSATCIDCHDYHLILPAIEPNSPIHKLQIANTCGQCHGQVQQEYVESIHWKSIKRGHFESPTCNNCHGEHRILSPLDERASTSRLNVSSQICANCHSSPIMMENFGLDPERFASYMRSYHGLAILKGSPDAASCVSCHEIHSIREQTSPESSINPQNLQNTCRKCHANISKEFANIPVHPSQLETRNPLAYYVKNLYIWLIVLIVGSMFIHNLIILLFYIKQKRKQVENERTYRRFQPFEVYQHALLFFSFTILVITGFALKFPDTMWVEWLVSLGMTEAIRSTLHRVAAVILIGISLVQVSYFLFHRKGRRDIALLIPNITDVTGFLANMKYHLGLAKERPKFGRWDYTEKAEYLALIWGTAVMALTGFVLWFPEFFISFLPTWIFELCEVVHYFEAWLATLAIIIWHFFFVIYHPEKYPMSLTWTNGKITEEEIKHHHPLEYQELSYIKPEEDNNKE